MKYSIIASRNLNPDHAAKDRRVYDNRFPNGKGNDLETLVNVALSSGASLVGGVSIGD